MLMLSSGDRSSLLQSYEDIRRTTECICRPLVTEDYVVQSMPDVSPPKWHLGHTTWFFEQFLLQPFAPDYAPRAERYGYIFNSYYHSFGERVAREQRGTLSRPTVSDVYAYRAAVNDGMRKLIANAGAGAHPEVAKLTELGLHHEQQHQELLLTDIRNIFASNPLYPVYANRPQRELPPMGEAAAKAQFCAFEGGLFDMGTSAQEFAWDNERPSHRVFVEPFRLMDRLVTCGEYLEFIEDGGYNQPLLWLSDGWDAVCRDGWQSPLYWINEDGEKRIVTLAGVRALDPSEPVSNVSYYEADAYARWAGNRLPSDAEWEFAAGAVRSTIPCGNFLESGLLNPAPLNPDVSDRGELSQMFGDAWEWTSSAYLPYPRFRPEPGPLAEYNAKFMSNQMVLRGGSCATPRSHIRSTYLNFFHCDKRWQFTGIRLAEDVA
jgi:ergothioneine biosynthesis protein EgtB